MAKPKFCGGRAIGLEDGPFQGGFYQGYVARMDKMKGILTRKLFGRISQNGEAGRALKADDAIGPKGCDKILSILDERAKIRIIKVLGAHGKPSSSLRQLWSPGLPGLTFWRRRLFLPVVGVSFHFPVSTRGRPPSARRFSF